MATTTRSRYLALAFALSLAFAFLPGVAGSGGPAALAQSPNPTFTVDPVTDGAWGGEFEPNAAITLSRGADSCTTTADDSGSFGFDLPNCESGGSLDLNAGETVQVTDGTTTKSHTITNLQVTAVDDLANTVTGTASSSDVYVWVHQDGTPGVVTFVGITWTADFDGSFDLVPGTYGAAQEPDEDGDSTNADWWVPDPRLNVDPNSEGLWGNDFVPNASVTVTVTRSGAPLAVPGSPFATDEWGNFGTGFEPSQLDLQAGDEVTMSDGASPKDHTITDLTVDVVNHDTNIVSGSAVPGSEVWVDLHGYWGVGRSVTADPSGSWSSDFDDPGNEGQTADFGPGENGSSSQCDADNDCTQIDWHAPNPRIDVDPASDNVWGNDFSPDDSVSITIGASTFGPYPTDRWGNFGTDQPLPVDIATGDTVTVFDATASVSHTVLLLEVTSVDAGLDVVTGIAGVNSRVDAWVHDVGNVNRTTSADTSGQWEVDFTAGGISDPNDQGTADLEPGSNGNSNTCDAAGSCTYASWHVSDPRITASVVHEEVWASDFPDDPEGQTLYYRLDDPATPEIDFESDMPLIVNQGGTEAGDRSFGRYDVQAGQIFTVRNRPFDEALGAGMERILAISHIEVTGVDGDLDTITGYADPAEGDSVCVWSQEAQLCSGQSGFTWEGDGTWLANFAAIGSDVRPGQWNSASQYEADGDETHHWWNLPPWVVVELAPEDESGAPLWSDKVRAEQWTGPVVTLAINGSDVDQWTVTGDGHHTFDPEIDIEPGDVVTLSDANDSKAITVELLTIDQINFAGDTPPNTVFGTASPYRNVRVDASATIGGWWAERWVDANASGDFSADFGTPGNGWREQWTAEFGGAEGLGRNVRVEFYDDDNDRVETFTCQGVPRVEVMRSDGRVEAYDFPAGHTVTLAITGEAGTFEAIAAIDLDNPCQTVATFDLGFEIPNGATMTATSTDPETGETTGTTSHTVSEFTIDGVDPEFDTVYGTATPGQRVLVEADGNNWRYVTAVDNGSGVGIWTADFSEQGPDPGEEHVVDLGPGSSGRALIIDEYGNTTELSWRISAAHFQVDPTSEMLWANEFLPNTQLFVTVNGTDVPGSPFFTDDGGNFDTSQVEWDPNNPRSFEAGDLILVTDGAATKDHIITNLAITSIDPESNVVSGMAAPESDVWVDIHGHWEAGRTVTADELGNWSADFDNAGQEGDTHDLEPGTDGYAQQCDDDSDCTQIQWRIASPSFWADATDDRITGLDFEPGSSVHVKVNDLVLEGSPFGTDGQGNFDTESLDIDLQVGDFVEVNDGTSFKEHLVTTLTVIGADAEADTVWGTATANEEVQILAGGSGFDWRRATADDNGNWTAFFGLPGTDPGFENPRDLLAGDQGLAIECDPDGDCTNDGWDLRLAQFQVDPQQEGLWANGFAGDTLLTVSIGDLVANGGQEVPGSPFWSDGDGNIGTGWDRNDLDLAASYRVFVTDGEITKDHTITVLAVDSIDPESNVVSGTAAPGSDVWVDIHGHWEAGRTVTADEFGDWATDFDDAGQEGDTHDLEPGTDGYAQQCDDDSDCTQINWKVANPTFSVRISNQQVHGYEWEEGVSVTLNINDPSNGPGVEYSATAIPEPAEWDPNQIFVRFAPLEWDEFEVLPGFEITMLQGATAKSHVVTALSVTSADPTNDTVVGQASSDAWVDVHVHETGANRSVQADGDGSWIAYFGVPGAEEWEQETVDIDIGTNGEAAESDGDGDNTQVEWSVPQSPSLSVRISEQAVHGYGWLDGASVTLTIDDDDPDTGVLFTGTETAGPAEWDPEQTFVWFGDFDFEILAGFVVSMTDGETTKTHTVVDIQITGVDESSLTIAGTSDAPEDSVVNVSLGHAWRDITPTGGTWTADLGSAPEPDAGEGELTVFGGNTSGGVEASDDDGDSTQHDIYSPYIHVSPHNDYVFGEHWAPGEPVTIKVGGVAIDPAPVPNQDGYLEFELDTAPENVVDAAQNGWLAHAEVHNLEITEVNVVADGMVSGRAPADTLVDVHVWTESGFASRAVTATEDGFTVDFSSPGGPEDWGPDPLEVGPGSFLRAHIYNDRDLPDHDATHHDWYVLNPTFSVETPHSVLSSNEDWELGDTITLTVDDRDFPADEPITTTVMPSEEDPAHHGWEFDLSDVFEIEPGQVVTVTSSSGVTKQLIVDDVTITEIDDVAGTVAGYVRDANGDPQPDVAVEVDVHNENGHAHRTAITDDDGYWVANFGLPGEGEGEEAQEFAIVPETNISAQVYDDDWDSTHRGDCFGCADGRFVQVYSTTAVPPVTDVVIAFGFTDDVTLSIVREGQSVDDAGWPAPYVEGDGAWIFVLHGVFDIEPGDIVIVSDADSTIEHVVTELAVTNIDHETNTISGVARPNHEVQFNMVVNPLGEFGEVLVDLGIATGPTGDWAVDLDDYVDFGPDGFVGSHGNIYDSDDDNPAQTTLDWWVEPVLTVVNQPGGFGDPARSEGVYGDGWILGDGVDVLVTTAEGAEVYVGSVFVEYACEAGALCDMQGGWYIDPGSLGFTLEPGTIVTASQWLPFFPAEFGLAGWERTATIIAATVEGPADPMPQNLDIIATAGFVDDRAGGHLVTIDWGDGSGPEPVAIDSGDYVDLGDGRYQVTVDPTHGYTEPGVYTLLLTVADGNGEWGVAEHHYVVVYDPEGKKITASVKWEPDEIEEKLGINVKFNKKTGEPKGKVSLEYEDDDADVEFEFEATSIDYLLIFGDWGITGGHGTFDDDDCDDDDDGMCLAGDFEFFVMALDQNKSSGIDAYRIKIWVAGDPSDVIYDTQPGEGDYAMPTREPENGNIKIK